MLCTHCQDIINSFRTVHWQLNISQFPCLWHKKMTPTTSLEDGFQENTRLYFTFIYASNTGFKLLHRFCEKVTYAVVPIIIQSAKNSGAIFGFTAYPICLTLIYIMALSLRSHSLRDSKISSSCVIYPSKLKRDSSAINYLHPGDVS